MIDPGDKRISIQRQCELQGLSKSSYYRETKSESEDNLMYMRLMDEEYTRHPFFGSRGMRDYLRRLGHLVGRKRMQRLMRIMGLVSVAPQKKTSIPAPGHRIYPYLLRNLDICRPDHVWCSDITYIRLNRGFVFLTAVMDWYSRYILSWEVSVTIDDSFCVSALERALRCHGIPEIFNSDQGGQYTGSDFTGVLKDHGISISMDGRGRATDNIAIERFWRSLKYEDIYLRDYETVNELNDGLREYFSWYNNSRSHQSLGGRTPAEVYNSSSLRNVA
jgi:putative transposase